MNDYDNISQFWNLYKNNIQNLSKSNNYINQNTYLNNYHYTKVQSNNNYFQNDNTNLYNKRENDSYFQNDNTNLYNKGENDSYFHNDNTNLYNKGENDSYFQNDFTNLYNKRENDSYFHNNSTNFYNKRENDSYFQNDSTNFYNKRENKNYLENNYYCQNKNKRDQNDIEKKPCGIINYGNNCYLNSGLQILAACDKFVEELKNDKYNESRLIKLLNDAFNNILKGDLYDPKDFLDYFCSINLEFFGSQSCSQNFIRTLLKNINSELIKSRINIIDKYMQYTPNKYEEKNYFKFISNNHIFPESKALSIFSGLSKSHSNGNCPKCGNKIEEISFSYFIDLNIYLDRINKKCNFTDVLDENFGKKNILTLNCPKCDKEIKINEETKIIKLPDILIFTLERYQDQTNNVEIIPEDNINMRNYIDKSIININTNYELFAINIRFGNNRNFGHEICQIKRNGKWYEVNDTISYEKNISHNSNSYGLFYKRKQENFNLNRNLNYLNRF